MRDTTNLKNRIKGLLGIILSVCTLVSFSKIPVYAETFMCNQYGSEGSYNWGFNGQSTIYIGQGDALNVTGGTLKVTGDWNAEFSWRESGTAPELAENQRMKVSVESVDGGTVTLRTNKLYPYTFKLINYDNSIAYTVDGITRPYSITEEMISKNVGQREGYELIGWAESEGSSTVKYSRNASVETFFYEPNQTLKLYSVWEVHIPTLEPGAISGSGQYNLVKGMYSYSGSFSIGDGFTYTGGDFYVPTAGTYTFK